MKDAPLKDAPFTPLEGGASRGATVFRCSLCGLRFTHGGRGCASCPLNTGCDVVSCPRCGHSFPRSSHVVAWIRQLVAWFRPAERRSW